MPSKTKTTFTSHIELGARGISDNGQRFVTLKIAGDVGPRELIVAEMGLDDPVTMKRLEAAGANLVSKAAQRELIARVQDHGLTPPTLQVATRVEMRERAMALPGGPYPPTKSFRVMLTDVPDDIQQKFMVAGSLKEWKKLARLGRGNSRVMLAHSMMFVGTLSCVMPVEHVGIQLIGEGGEAKTAITVAASSVWGWDPNSTVADQNGFGLTWNSTINAFEQAAAGYNQTILLLNETGTLGGQGVKFAAAMLEVIMKIEGAVGKGRLTETGRRSWYAPLLSTSNVSVVALAKMAGRQFDAAYVDRLADVPVPAGGHGMLENLHGYTTVAELAVAMKAIAAENHGVAGRAFLKAFYAWKGKDEGQLVAWLEKRRKAYLKRAEKRIKAACRNLTRIHGKFATIYAAGALAIRFGVLPWTRKALLKAILKCEADHVCFVEAEQGDGSSGLPALERLRAYLRDHRTEFVDLRNGEEASAEAVEAAEGFIGTHGNKSAARDEFWLRERVLRKVMGGKIPADEVKAELASQGMLATEAGNDGKRRFVVRRLVGKAREQVIAIPLAFVEGGTA